MSARSTLLAGPITAILFDVDGTLYDARRMRRAIFLRLARYASTNPPQALRTLRVIRAYRHALETLRAQSAVCDVAAAQMQLAAEGARTSAGEARAIIERWFGGEALRVLPSCAHPGLKEFLERAADAGVKMGIVSDYEADWKLDSLGIRRYFEVVVTPASTGRLKPHPAVLQKAIDLLQADPAQTLYIGDRLDVDLPAAQSVGIRCAILGARSPSEAGFLPFRAYSGLANLLWPPAGLKKGAKRLFGK